MGTLMKCTGDFLKGSYEGRNMRFGIREFGMGAVCNAVSLDRSGLVPYCATFTIFTDYMRNAIRLAALAQAGTIFVTTHDSIAVGEDGLAGVGRRARGHQRLRRLGSGRHLHGEVWLQRA